MADETRKLLRDILDRVDSGFREAHERVAALEEKTAAAHGGVRMTLAAIDGLQKTVDTVANGMIQLSAQVSQLRDGVASQVRHEVEKSLDDRRTISELPGPDPKE